MPCTKVIGKDDDGIDDGIDDGQEQTPTNSFFFFGVATVSAVHRGKKKIISTISSISKQNSTSDFRVRAKQPTRPNKGAPLFEVNGHTTQQPSIIYLIL